MENYQRRYYASQTQARGLTDPIALKKEFDKVKDVYQIRIGHYLPMDRSAPILDCPCGYGNILYFLRSQGYTNYAGIDLDPEQVALAKKLELKADIGNAFDHLQSSIGYYAAIISVDFLEHLNRNDCIRFMDLVHRSLTPNGKFIARTPCCDGPFGAAHRYNDMTHEWGMTSTVATTLLRMTGFDEIRILEERPLWYRPRLKAARRIISYHIAKYLATKFFKALTNYTPKVWTPSMWVIGSKAP